MQNQKRTEGLMNKAERLLSETQNEPTVEGLLKKAERLLAIEEERDASQPEEISAFEDAVKRRKEAEKKYPFLNDPYEKYVNRHLRKMARKESRGKRRKVQEIFESIPTTDAVISARAEESVPITDDDLFPGADYYNPYGQPDQEKVGETQRKIDRKLFSGKDNDDDNDDDDNDDDKNGSDTENSKGMDKHTKKTILKLLSLIADVTRRILSAVVSRASQALTDVTNADTLNTSPLRMRDYRIFELAHGLQQNTFLNAISGTQRSFGLVESLDEKALSTMAPVLGTDLERLVRSGIGGSDPERLVHDILNAYYEQWQKGLNSLNVSVGQDASRRSLVTSLQSVNPALASLLERMIADQSSQYYGDINNVDEWLESTVSNRMGETPVQERYNAELAQELNQLKSIIADLKDGILGSILRSISGILDYLVNNRVGMSDEESVALDMRNRARNLSTRNALQTANDTLSDMWQGRVQGMEGFEGLSFAIIDDAINMKESEFVDKYAKTQSDRRAWKNTYKKISARTADKLVLNADKEVGEAFTAYRYNAEKIRDIEKENSKDKKINAVTATDAERGAYIKKEYSDMVTDIISTGKIYLTSPQSELYGTAIQGVRDYLRQYETPSLMVGSGKFGGKNMEQLGFPSNSELFSFSNISTYKMPVPAEYDESYDKNYDALYKTAETQLRNEGKLSDRVPTAEYELQVKERMRKMILDTSAFTNAELSEYINFQGQDVAKFTGYSARQQWATGATQEYFTDRSENGITATQELIQNISSYVDERIDERTERPNMQNWQTRIKDVDEKKSELKIQITGVNGEVIKNLTMPLEGGQLSTALNLYKDGLMYEGVQ